MSLSGAATIVGDRLPAGAPGLVLGAAAIAIDGLTISGVPGVAIRVAGAEDAAIDGVTLSGNGAGIQIDDGSARVAVGAMQGVTITANDGPGIVVAGRAPATSRSRTAASASRPPAWRAATPATACASRPARPASSWARPPAPSPLRTAQVTGQTANLVHTIRGRVILNGQPAPAGTIVEALIDGRLVAATTVGVVDVDGAPGFVLTITGPGLVVRFRVAGLPAARLVFFEPGARSDIVLEAMGEFPQSELALPGANVIAYNAGAGLRHDAGLVTYRGNAIYATRTATSAATRPPPRRPS